jgi:hypothetical protein
MNLLKNVKLTRVAVSYTSGDTDISEERVIDMAGFDGVMFVGLIGSAATTGYQFKVVPCHSSATGTTDMVPMSTAGYGAGTTAGTTLMEESLVVVDVYRPTKRYMSAIVDRDTGSTDVEIDGVIAIQYKNRYGPVSQSTSQYGVVASTVAVSPTT